jgi:hypothetical protein
LIFTSSDSFYRDHPGASLSLRLAMVFMACLTANAQADQVEINWEADGRFGYEALLDGEAMAEVCGPLNENDVVEWKLKSATPVDFNIHYHQGDEVVYPARINGTRELGDRLNITLTQTYCWMLTNPKQSPTVIELNLQLNPD